MQERFSGGGWPFVPLGRKGLFRFRPIYYLLQEAIGCGVEKMRLFWPVKKTTGVSFLPRTLLMCLCDLVFTFQLLMNNMPLQVAWHMGCVLLSGV